MDLIPVFFSPRSAIRRELYRIHPRNGDGKQFLGCVYYIRIRVSKFDRAKEVDTLFKLPEASDVLRTVSARTQVNDGYCSSA